MPYDNNALDSFNELINTVEIPMYLGGPSVSGSFLAKELSKDGNKIAISGTGADELCCGYPRFYVEFYISLKFITSIFLEQLN